MEIFFESDVELDFEQIPKPDVEQDFEITPQTKHQAKLQEPQKRQKKRSPKTPTFSFIIFTN